MDKSDNAVNINVESEHIIFKKNVENYVLLSGTINAEAISTTTATTFSIASTFTDTSDDPKLLDLLKQFDLECLFVDLKAANVTYWSLQFIKREDLAEAIPHLGLRIEFREKLFAWRKTEFGINDKTISVQKKVENWLQNVPSTYPLEKDLERIPSK